MTGLGCLFTYDPPVRQHEDHLLILESTWSSLIIDVVQDI
jgi:hypothetical protein